MYSRCELDIHIGLIIVVPSDIVILFIIFGFDFQVISRYSF